MFAASWVLWSSLVVGFVASALALYGRYRALPAFLTGPAICRLEDNGCQALFRTHDAALLGVPNSFLGLAFYGFLALGLRGDWPTWFLFSAGTIALGMTLYLGALLLRKRLECRICWVGHAANIVLWLTLGTALLVGA